MAASGSDSKANLLPEQEMAKTPSTPQLQSRGRDVDSPENKQPEAVNRLVSSENGVNVTRRGRLMLSDDDKIKLDFIYFYDDCDVDGSNSISEAEIVSRIPWLISRNVDESVQLEESRILVRQILLEWSLHDTDGKPLWTGKLPQELKKLEPAEHEDKCSMEDCPACPSMRDEDELKDFLHLDMPIDAEFSRSQLTDILYLAKNNGRLKGYQVGEYADRVSAPKPSRRFPWWTFFIEELKLLFFPIGVFFVDMRQGEQGESLIRWDHFWWALASLPLWTMLTLNVWFLYDDTSGVRTVSGSKLPRSEALAPFFFLVVYITTWNLARAEEGLGPFSRYRYSSYRRQVAAEHRRYRLLQASHLSNVFTYQDAGDAGKNPAWTLDKSYFKSAWPVYKNIFNIVGLDDGYEDFGFGDLPKDDVDMSGAFEDQPQARQTKHTYNSRESRSPGQSWSYVLFTREVFLTVLFFASFLPLVHPLVRVLHTDESQKGDFFVDNGSNTHIYLVSSSFFLTWIFITLSLVGVERYKYYLRAFHKSMEILSALVNRRKARQIQFSLRDNLRYNTPKELQVPWINLGDGPDNIFSWNEIRLSVLSDWNGKLDSFPKVFVAVPFVVMSIFFIAMMMSVFIFFSQSGDGFRWFCFVGGMLYSWRLFSFADAAEDVNQFQNDHLAILSQVQLSLDIKGVVAARTEASKHEREQHMKVDERNKEEQKQYPVHRGSNSISDVNTLFTPDNNKYRPSKIYEAQAGLVGSFISSIQLNITPYVAIYGIKIDSLFQTRMFSVFSLWILLVVANFLFAGFNF